MLIKDNRTVSQEKNSVETFSKHQINIATSSSEIKSYNITLEKNVSENNSAIDPIKKLLENHASIAEIK